MNNSKRKTADGPIMTTEGKEEISMALAELGNVKPKQEPMTPNQRDKTEKEKKK